MIERTPIYRFIAWLLVFAMTNLLVPPGTYSQLVHDVGNVSPAPQMPPSRELSQDEMRTLRGRIGANPSWAGSEKWAPQYKGVDLLTGNFSTSATDLSFEGGYGIPINVTRSYSANNPDEGPFGAGWTLNVDLRTTAGGLLKSARAPIRAVPAQFRERHSLQDDLRLTSVEEPVEAVIATDAAGYEVTMQRDVDGIITPPAWDPNVIETQYERVQFEGAFYDVAVAQKATTPEGTVYTYAKQGYFEGGSYPRGHVGNGTAEPANILKIRTVTDRYGNTTTYNYDSSTWVTFARSNGTAKENPLRSVTMPGGRSLHLAWAQVPGTNHWRVAAIADGPQGDNERRVVTYGYNASGYLTSVTGPGGKTTAYGYGSWGTGPLTHVTDPRGLVTVINYAIGTTALPYASSLNGTLEHAHWLVSSIQNPGWRPAAGSDPGNHLVTKFSWEVSSDPESPVVFDEPTNMVEEFYGPEGLRRTSARFHVRARVEGQRLRVIAFSGILVGFYDLVRGQPGWEKFYDLASRNLMLEVQRSAFKMGSAGGPLSDGIFTANRDVGGLAWENMIEKLYEYNALGMPLASTDREYGPPENLLPVLKRQVDTEYAYWGLDRALQQKAVRTRVSYPSTTSWRYSFTDYYPMNDPFPGRRGQVRAVYAHGLDGGMEGGNFVGRQNSFSAFDSDPNWRNNIDVQAGWVPSARFHDGAGNHNGYDAHGRVVSVYKLSKFSGSTPVYVRTTTSYGGDGPPAWGLPLNVVEDAGGLNRTTTTNEYDRAGRATSVTDANGRTLLTTYDLDGRIQSVHCSTTPRMIATYGYGASGVSNGAVTEVVDGVSGATQSVQYVHNGDGLGQVASIAETGPAGAYTVSYEYDPAGRRKRAIYATPEGVRRWAYGDYVSLGDPANPTPVFQTMALMEMNGANEVETSEQFQYLFDTSGRLHRAWFALTPQATDAAPFYLGTNEWPASNARATYEYDSGGRLSQLTYDWQRLEGGQQAAYPLYRQAYAYDLWGRRTGAAFSERRGGAMQVQRTEAYAYHPTLDYLIRYDHQDAGSAAKFAEWSYDAAGNRTRASDKPGAWTYDALNRMTGSPYGAYTNDMAGNRTGEAGCVNHWDEANRLVAISTTASGYSDAWFDYRADGMRAREYYEAVGGGGALSGPEGGAATMGAPFGELHRERLHRYDGQMPMEVVTREGSGMAVASVRRHALGARGIDRIETWTPSSGTDVAYPVYDGHGNRIQALRRGQFAGGVPADMPAGGRTDPWGVFNGGRTHPAAQYCANLGHPTDGETGLVYMRARYYEPWTGRFLSEDPARDGWNWFAYCGNEPTNRRDVDGRVAGPWDKVVELILRVAKSAGIEVYSVSASLIIIAALGDAAMYWAAANKADAFALLSATLGAATVTSAALMLGPGLFALAAAAKGVALLCRLAILYTAYDMLVKLWLLSDMDDAFGVTPPELPELVE
jgi:RHS repeat-associated protein